MRAKNWTPRKIMDVACALEQCRTLSAQLVEFEENLMVLVGQDLGQNFWDAQKKLIDFMRTMTQCHSTQLTHTKAMLEPSTHT